MAVRTLNFFSVVRTGSAAPVGPTTQYTVPSGHTAILKEVTVSTFAAGNAALIVYAGPPSSLQIVYADLAAPAVEWLHIPMWMVLEPGFVIQTFFDLANASDIAWLSAHGSLLEGVV